MSKVGRKPIELKGVLVDVKGQEVHYKGKKASGTYVLPNMLEAQTTDGKLFVTVKSSGITKSESRDANRLWGLNRALLANDISGAESEFEKLVLIVGLGYKAVLSGNTVVFALGYSHKINYEIPKGVSLEIDKTGQKLTFKSSNKELLGQVCADVRSFRRPEPYKGTGIRLSTEEIVRKAGKSKS